MLAMTAAGRVRTLAERLIAALADPQRRTITIIALITGYVAVWTVYAVLAKGSQGLHFDMTEQFALSRELAIGYAKHPPLAMAVVRGWFTVFPATDWAYYLLAVVVVAVALVLIWQLLARFLDPEKQLVGIALLTLVPFFNFHALKYNQNTVLMPLWAATTLFFIRSYETRRPLYAALAGLAAAAAVYGKYWSVMLLAGLGVAALVDSRRRLYFRSTAPWITIAVGAIALAPHVVWLVTNDFAPSTYAFTAHHAASFADILVSIKNYLVGAAVYIAVPVLVVLIAAQPNLAALADMAWPATTRRRFAALAFWATLLVPIVIALVAQFPLTSLWTMSTWALLPVLLLSSPLVTLNHRGIVNIVVIAVMFPFVMVALAPAIAFAIHRNGVAPGADHSVLLAKPVEQLWRTTTDAPLRLFDGFQDFGYGVAFYLPSKPAVVPALDGSDPPGLEDRILRFGIALVCPATEDDCVRTLDARVARSGSGAGRSSVDIFRTYLGDAGPKRRYIIAAIPPA